MTGQRPDTVETITVGPCPIFFCNQNLPMGIKSHCHQADVWVTYETRGRHGYPSFEQTNAELRDLLRGLTGVERPFRDATNEDVVRDLFNALDGLRGSSWDDWGGEYRLWSVRLDIHASADTIGHDPGTTTYTVTRAGNTREG